MTRAHLLPLWLLALQSCSNVAPPPSRITLGPGWQAAADRRPVWVQASPSGQGAWRSAHQATGLRAWFGQAGLRVEPLQAVGAHLTLKTVALRCDQATMANLADAPARQAADGSLERQAGPVTEWLRIDERDLEHGYRVAPPPAGCASVEVEMTSAGGTLHPAGSTGLWASLPGGTAVHYRGLRAFDAAGRDLPATLRVAGTSVILTVDTRLAVGEITIDPLLTTVRATFDAGADAAPSGRFGQSAAIDGRWALVGAASSATRPDGAVYAYRRDGDGAWALAEVWSEPAAGFGSSVALANGAALVGAPGSNQVFAWEYDPETDGWAPGPDLSFASCAPPGGGARFGQALDVEPGFAAIGAPGARAFYAFARLGDDSGGEGVWTWSCTHRVSSGHLEFGAAVTSRRPYTLVGAPGSDRALLFERNRLPTVFVELNGPAGSRFGAAVAYDAGRMVIGAPSADGGRGRVEVRGRDAGGLDSWGIEATLEPVGSSGFGSQVSLDAGWIAAQSADALGLFASEPDADEGPWPLRQSLPGGPREDLEDDSLALREGQLLWGSSLAEVEGTASGAATLATLDGDRWLPTTVSLPEDEGAGLATILSLDGDFLVVGAPDSDLSATDAGAVYPFQRTADGWTLLHDPLEATTPTANAHFGYSVDLQNDRLAVGEPSAPEGGLSESGRAYLFERGRARDGLFALLATLRPTTSEAGALYGSAVSVDRDRVAVGAPTAGGRGLAYVHERNQGGFNVFGVKDEVGPAELDTLTFGAALDLDGDRLMVGAPLSAGGAGRLYGYTLLTSELSPWPVLTGTAGSRLGTDLALAGPQLAAGQPFAPSGGVARGEVLIWPALGADDWGDSVRLPSPDPVDNGRFGQSVSLVGGRLVVGQPATYSAGLQGQAWTFLESRDWGLESTLVSPEGAAGDGFGAEVSAWGTRVAVGAAWAPRDGFGDGGQVQVFELDLEQSPLAADDAWGGTEDVPLVVGAPGLLANDSDPNGDPLTARLLEPPPVGTVTVLENGSFRYDPEPDYWGEVAFTYSAEDGRTSTPARVVLTLDPTPDAPVAADDAFSGPEDVVFSIDVRVNDRDADGDPLTVQVERPPSHLGVFRQIDGALRITPDPDWHGEDSFTYRVSDGARLSEPATVRITINPVDDAPRCSGETYVVAEDDRLVVSAPGVLANDEDPEDAVTLEAVLTTPPDAAEFSLAPNGALTYRRRADAVGTEQASYRVRAGSQTCEAVVTLTTTPVNDPPVAAPDAAVVAEDSNTLILVLANDLDPDGDRLTTRLIASPLHGTATVEADGAIRYFPSPNYQGEDTLRYAASDGLVQAEASVALTVTGLPDAPVCATPPPRVYLEGESAELGAADFLPYVTDADLAYGDLLQFSPPSDYALGAFVALGDGGYRFDPPADFAGDAPIQRWRATDTTGRSCTLDVQLSWSNLPDAPVCTNLLLDGVEDAEVLRPADVGLAPQCSDIDGEALTFAAAAPCEGATWEVEPDGSFRLVPDPDRSGLVTCAFLATDPAGLTARAEVQVDLLPAPDLPVPGLDLFVATEDSVLSVDPPGVLINDLCPDGPCESVALDRPAAHGLVVLEALTGSLSYTPDPNFFGIDEATYRLRQGGQEATGRIQFTVEGTPDAPDAAEDTYGLSEDTPLVVSAEEGLLANDVDVDVEPLTATALTSPSFGTLELNLDGSFVYTPNPSYNGADEFWYRASDGELTGDALVRLTVSPVDDRPVAAGDRFALDEDSVLSIEPPGLLANDVHPDGLEMSTVLVNPPLHARDFTLGANGEFIYEPNPDFSGLDQFSYYVASESGLSGAVVVVLDVRPVPDPPRVVGEAFNLLEDGRLDLDLAANDVDPDGDALRYRLLTPPALGTLDLNEDGQGTYQGLPDANGADFFTYEVDDGAHVVGPVRADLTLTAVDDAPRAVGETVVLLEDQTVRLSPTINDLDVEGSPLTLIVTQNPMGSLVSSGPNLVDYTPPRDFNGRDAFRYRVQANGLLSAEVEFGLEVVAVPDAPIAVDDLVVSSEDTPVAVDAPGVLANDSDGDGDPLVAILASSVPEGASFEISTDGAWSLLPPPHFFGELTFEILVSDPSGLSDVGTLRVVVEPVDDPPVAAPDAWVLDEDTPLAVAAPGVLGNDVDVDGDPLSALLAGAPAFGTLSLSPDGGFLYTPAPDAFGLDHFTYRPMAGSVVGELVTVDLEVRPVADPVRCPAALEWPEVEGAPTFAVTVNQERFDPDGGAVTLDVLTAPAGVLAEVRPDGSVWVTLDADVFGPQQLTFQATDDDGTTCEFDLVLVLEGQPDDPVALDDRFELLEDTTLVLGPAEGPLANDSDPDREVLTLSLESPPSAGDLQVDRDGSLTFTPPADQYGWFEATLRSTDPTGRSVLSRLTLEVLPSPDAPRPEPDAWVTDEDLPLTLAAPGVLTNDVEVDGEALTAELVSPPLLGSVELASDGGLLYVPGADLSGEDAFTYLADDGLQSALAEVRIEVRPLDDVPRPQPDRWELAEDEPFFVAAPGVLNNDRELDGEPLTARLVVGPRFGTVEVESNGGFSYQPDPSFNGEDSFQYAASDGLTEVVAEVTLVVSPVEDAPIAFDDAYMVLEDVRFEPAPPGVLGNDLDPDGDPLSLTLLTEPSFALDFRLHPDGSFTYEPLPDWSGRDSFTYQVDDGRLSSAPATVALEVEPIADPPQAVADRYSTLETTPLSVESPGVLANDADPDGEPLAAQLLVEPTFGTLTLQPDGGFEYVADAGFLGTDTFTYAATDPTGMSHEAQVEVEVLPINRPPLLPSSSWRTPEDLPLAVEAPGVLEGAVDEGPVTAVLVTPPRHASAFTLNPDGSFDWAPLPDYFGVDFFEVEADDGELRSERVRVELVVDPLPDSPRPQDDELLGEEDRELTADLLANDLEVDGEALTAVLVLDPGIGTLTLAPNGALRLNPLRDLYGEFSLVYAAVDESGLRAEATARITLAPSPDAPNATDDLYEIDEDLALEVAPPGVLANDSDPDGEPGLAELVRGPSVGELTLRPDGGLTWLPPADWHGEESAVYRAVDPIGLAGEATVRLVVHPVDDAPRCAGPDLWEGREDETLVVPAPGVLGGDVHPDGLGLIVELVDAPPAGELTLNPDGSFAFVPPIDSWGRFTFSYRAVDPRGDACPAVEVHLDLQPVEDPPVGVADAWALDEDTLLAVPAPGVLANDTSPDAGALTAVLETAPTFAASFLLAADGSFSYQPLPDWNGVDRFTYRPFGASLSGPMVEVLLEVRPAPDLPVGVDDRWILEEDTLLELLDPGVLANDLHPDGGELEAELLVDVDRGALSLRADGGLTYEPEPDFAGEVRFRYRPRSAAGAGTEAEVLLEVRPLPDLPLAAPDAYLVLEESELRVSAEDGVLSNDTDADADPLEARLVRGPTSALGFSLQADGSFTYQPAAGFVGVDQFTYRAVAPDGESAETEVSLTVGPPGGPPSGTLDAYLLAEDESLRIGASAGVLANDLDPDGDALSAVLVAPPLAGSLTLDPDGGFFYRPAPDFEGSDEFSYQASDGSFLSEVVAVVLDVRGVPDPPFGQPEEFNLAEDGSLVVSSEEGVLSNDLDVDLADTLRAELVQAPVHGTLVLELDGSFRYVPSPDFSGVDLFIYEAIDRSALGSGPVQVSLNVRSVLDDPRPEDDEYTVAARQVWTVEAEEGVLANDYDPEGEPLLALLVDHPPVGDLQLGPDGSFTFIAPEGFVGEVRWSYAATAGTREATADVIFHLDPPNTDSGCELRSWFVDADGDGYGAKGNAVLDCRTLDGHVERGGDCNDRDPEVHPKAPEIPEDGVDQNCDGFDVELMAKGTCQQGAPAPAALLLVAVLAARRRRDRG